MVQLVERPHSTQDIVGSNPARGSSFFLLRKKELSLGVVVYFALSLRMSLHAMNCYIQYICYISILVKAVVRVCQDETCFS